MVPVDVVRISPYGLQDVVFCICLQPTENNTVLITIFKCLSIFTKGNGNGCLSLSEVLQRRKKVPYCLSTPGNEVSAVNLVYSSVVFFSFGTHHHSLFKNMVLKRDFLGLFLFMAKSFTD